jgi:peptide/nickel transport system substrate-binding protein
MKNTLLHNRKSVHQTGGTPNSDTRLLSIPTPSPWYLGLCQCDPDLQKVEVRQAFKWLVDYEQLENTVMKNIGITRQSVVPLGSFGAIPAEDEPYSLDLEKAKALMAEAGFPDGFKKTLIVDQEFPFPELAQHVQENAAQIGIELEIQQMAAAQLYGQFRARDFELGIFSWTTDVPDAHGMISRHVYNPDNSDAAKATMLPAWRVGWDTDALGLTEKIEAAKREIDPEKRKQMYWEIQKTQLEHSPLIYLFQQIDNIAVRNEVKEFPVTSFKKYYSLIEKK